jgi:acyl transferase domain-containing protein/acyl carrier protein
MEKVGKNFNQEWGNHIARQFRRAWNGQLPVEEFSRLLEPSFVFHFHGQIICGIPKYHDFIRQARQTTKNLDVIEEFVLSQDNLVLLFFRWSSEQWHQDVVAGGRLSNFCKVVFRVEDGKIAEIWEQAPDFLYLLGKIKQKEIMRYPLVIEENLLIQEKEGLYPANDPQTTMMSNLFKRMNDCFLGRSSLRNMKDIQNKDMTFYNGDTQGSGVEAWKTFAYALHSCLGSHSPKRFDDLYIRNGDELTVFLRANSEHESPYILRCANGLVASLKLKERDGKIQMLATHLENYIPFLDTDFSNHKTRIRDLFHGRREPVVEPVTGFDHPQRGKMKRVAVAASPESFDTGEEQVAIVGMAGRFPKCNSIEEYWEALVSKKNLFSETPPKRLYIQQGTKIRYAGFIDDVDLFDAPFFQILPSEAEYIDPQQRLLLEEIVQCIADSGHPSSDYSGPRTGLFVTTLSEDYKKLLQDKGLILSPLSWGGNEMAMFPPKIARFLNIQGPCHYINAECASSLVAIHEASSLIRQGSIDQAIIGATNLFLHPYGFAVREETLLTTEPFPRLFSKQSKGQLRGEAIVSVILKSLSKAIEDKDFIYGIVAGSAVNNSGKTLSLAAGNVEQQAKVITEAWGQANIQPSDVSLIECHASGVRGGDFAEIAAIKQAFNGKKGATDRKHVCHISSVKGAIGHAEAASGLTALVKLLLQLQHQQIVGTQGLEELDPELRIDPDRFNLVRDAIPWGSAEKSGTMQPRVAGINGFAVGGYNAHVVIQEFVPRREKDTSRYLTPSDSPPVDGVSSRPESNRTVIVLSAHAEPSLKAQLRNFRQYLYAHPSIDLEDLACTLQLGRDAMRYRAAFVVSSVDELIQQMGTVLESKPLPPQVFIGKKGGKRVGEMKGAERSDDQMDEVILQNDLLKIAERWSQGQAIPWSQLKRQKGRRLLAGLPLYPFDRKSYWVPETENRKTSSEEANLIHPLLHQNTSNVYLQRYRTVFTGKELFLSDHVVQGHKVLPGVAYLEMIRVAVRNALQEPTQTGSPREGGPSIQIRNIVWIQPIVVDAKNPSPVEVQVELFPVDYSEVELQPGGSTHQAVKTIAFEIYSIHCQGQATIRFNQAAPLVDLSALQAVCGQADLTSQQIYTAYQAMGLAYGPAYRGIESLQIGQDAKGAPQVLAKLTRPSVWKNHDEYVLHPSMMDSAVQAAIALVMDSGGVPSYQRPPLPFALEEVDIHHPCTSRMWAWVRFSASSDGEGAIGEDTRGSGRVQKIDIDVIDAYGKLCVRMARLSSRTSDKGTTKQFTQNSNDDSTSASSGTTNRIELDEMQEKVLDFLKHKVARILKVKPENIDIEEELNEYGFDSIHLTDFGNQLNEEYQLPVDRPLNPTIFFEYPTLKSVTGYLVREYRDFVREKYFGSRPRQKTSEGLPERTTPLADSTGSAARLRRPAHRFSPVTRTIVPSPSYGKTDIAIVGMSGRFPMANDVDEFWENLVTGKDCITEIPRDRWDWQALYGDPTKEPNKTNMGWIYRGNRRF